MFGIGFTEILVVLVVALIVLGPEKLPEIGVWLGKIFRQYKIARDELKQRIDLSHTEPPPRQTPPAPAENAPTTPAPAPEMPPAVPEIRISAADLRPRKKEGDHD